MAAVVTCGKGENMTKPQPPTHKQCVDAARPHTLLTESPRKSPTLLYRYDDSGEEVTVPNLWYNQPFSVRADYLGWLASLREEAAEALEKRPPAGLQPHAVKLLAESYREQAVKLRSASQRLMAAGCPVHPVAASLLPLAAPGDLT